MPLEHTMSQNRDGISERMMKRQLSGLAEKCHVLSYRHLPSTNACAKAWAKELSDGTLIIAKEQSAGRGRMQRAFYSPGNTGLYMSLFLKRLLPAAMATRLTTIAAVAAAHVIEAEIGRRIGIKWVNDLYLDGRKVCGILTEGAMVSGTAALEYAVIGIGINLTPPTDGFPTDISTIAGAILPQCDDAELLRCRLAANILNTLIPMLDSAMSGGACEEAVWQAYHERLLLRDREVTVHRGDGTATVAQALDIDRDYRLLVRYHDGTVDILDSGEVSVRL